MSNFKSAIIMGIAALVVVVITVIAVTSGNVRERLTVSDVNGDVTITDANGATEKLEAGRVLSKGDIVTVNDGACTIAYCAKDGADENFVMLDRSSQVFVSDEFDGRGEDELYLNRGALIVNGLGAKKCAVKVRTDSSSVLTNGSVIRVAYNIPDEKTDDEKSKISTEVASFGGPSEIQLFNTLGEKVDRDGNIGGASEPMGNGLSAKIMSGEPPVFDYLNIPTVITNYDQHTLRDLLTVSSTGELFFTAAEIKAAYDAAPEEIKEPEVTEVTEPEPEEDIETVSETEAEPETVTESETTTEVTTEPITTTVTTTRAPETTTTRATTTAAPVTTVQTTTTKQQDMISVYIIVGDEITEQQVPYGGNAIRPADPSLDGKRFIGWDDSFDNITEERTIIANFEDIDSPPAPVITETNTETGMFITPPDELVTDYIPPETYYDGNGGFIDGGYGNVPAPGVYHTVTFMVDGMSYDVQVADGQNAVPPVIPPQVDSNGQHFLAWDKMFSNVTSDMTVYAVYG